MTQPESYPRLAARTRNFTLGRPRSFTLSPDGRRLLFLRSASGTDPVQRLWLKDLQTGAERCVVDPSDLAADAGELPPEERARRERAREQAGGVVRYATDRSVERVVFTLAGDLWVTDLSHEPPRQIDVEGPVVDPRLDPHGRAVAWVRQGSLRVTSLDDGATHTVVGEDRENVSWGLAEFVAAEEMGRTRGYWWSPTGERLLVTRVDTAPVARWWIASPVDPAAAPTPVAYPAAGTPNADVSLHVVSLDGNTTEIVWDRDTLPYLADVHWEPGRPPLMTVQSRDQRRLAHLAIDPDSGSTRPLVDRYQEPWIDLVEGIPRWGGERLVSCVDDLDADVRRVAVDGAPVTPIDLHVRDVVAVTDEAVIVRASAGDPTHIGLWRINLAAPISAEEMTPEAGVHAGVSQGAVTVLQRSALDSAATVTTVLTGTGRWTVADVSEKSPIQPRVRRLQLGPKRLEAALLRPADLPDDEPLPVLLDPYGGPHAQRVLQAQAAFRTSQWFADQGFAVLVVDGRGTPGRGPSWEHAVHQDLAEGVLDDQVTALRAAAEESALDLDRVAIRGWSFGGYLAALAVLRRPDVFHAAIAGAPVTEWRLYDTHYTERYLGDPEAQADVYDRNSLLPLASRLERPLLLIHGLADDNVVVAHTLALSQALLEAGRPHQVLPLSGVTHMTPQEVVAENLMHLQADFLQRSLDG